MYQKETRTDCEYFELKPYSHSCGDCQTDGHYLCGNCRRIADFDDMELSDNRMHYYPEQEKRRILIEEAEYQKEIDDIINKPHE